jgi:A/G-specific adenine glycosylase
VFVTVFVRTEVRPFYPWNTVAFGCRFAQTLVRLQEKHYVIRTLHTRILLSMNKADGFDTRTMFAKPLSKPGSIPDVQSFQKLVYGYYRKHGRDLPWRRTKNPYRIFVSEIMLQQTQVDRVLKKYTAFIETFPGVRELSKAPLEAVLREWRGLGYNRRCLYLKQSAAIIEGKFGGKIPNRYEDLLALPGIGRSTASSILAFGFEIPTVFIETNIRSLFIHFFFPGQTAVGDSDIYPLVEKTLDIKNPRRWYYALMDYGSALKRCIGSLNSRSTQYTRQSRFKGSKREVRGRVLRVLLDTPGLREHELVKKAGKDSSLVDEVITELVREGFIIKKKGGYSIAKGIQS